MKKVVIFQHRLVHYRTSLFDRLRDTCYQRGIALTLVHGQASRRESQKKDEGNLPWAHKVRNKIWEVGERDVIWQPFPSALHDADLVVLMQENRILSNYRFLFGHSDSLRRIAYWGHGINFQSAAPNGLRERWKRLLLTRVDWWFAYTSLTAELLEQAGYPQSRVTCLNNAIDNDGFKSDLASIATEEVTALRARLGATNESPIGLFCGSLYPDMRLEYLIAACDLIQAAVPAFRLIVIGDGPDAQTIRSAAHSRPWLEYVGVRKGREKALYFRAADIVLNPGLVGLHVLDAFCAGTPMITTQEARHSPEIAYLDHGVNGLILSGNAGAYASDVISLLADISRLKNLQTLAEESANRFSLENMVAHFADGLEQCLAMPKK